MLTSPSISAGLDHGGYTLLFGSGAYPPVPLIRRLFRHARMLVCADGGANVAHRCGITPDCIIGDLDSIRDDARTAFHAAGVEFIHLHRQTDTDLEKALLHLRRLRHRRLVGMGLTGRLLDHTLGNLSVLTRHVPHFDMTLIDPDYRIDVITAEAHFDCATGDRISLVPLTACRGIRTSGLQYALRGGDLLPGIREGTSNAASSDHFTVRLREGVMMVMRPISCVFC